MCLQWDYQVKNLVARGKKIRKKYKEKEDHCQSLQDEVISLRNQVNENDTTTKELKERTNYCEGIET